MIVLGPALMWGLAALILPRISCNDEWRSAENGIEIGVYSNGVHTDFVLPVRALGIDWQERLGSTSATERGWGFEWVAFGWGDRGFYLEAPTIADVKLGTALVALSGCGESAMHVTWMWSGPYSDERARRLVVTEEQYRALCDYVFASFERDDAGLVRRIDHPGYSSFDGFFEAHDSYSAIRTCNEWTGAGLRLIGVRTGVWTPFAGDVLRPLPR